MNNSDLGLVISPQDIQPHLNDPKMIILDMSSTYLENHIPSATPFNYNDLLHGTPPITNDIITTTQFNLIMQAYGIEKDSHIIVYDDQFGAPSGRFIWTCHSFGFNRVSYLNGGIQAWKAANLDTEITTYRAQPTTTPYQAQFTDKYLITLTEIQQHIATQDIAIWDTRSLNEYTGEKQLANKSGHIPTAQHCEWLELIDIETGKLQDKQKILEIIHKKFTSNNTLVPYCQTHRRSSLAYLAARYAGITNIKCYAGSWNEWGNHPSTLIEK